MTAGLALVVDPDDPTPAYEQLRRQVTDLVATGALRAGERLPPLRQLAGDLGLAVGTVARAYRELETDGLLSSRRGGGTRVAATATGTPDQASDRRERLEGLARTYATRARALGATETEIRAALDAVGPPAGP